MATHTCLLRTSWLPFGAVVGARGRGAFLFVLQVISKGHLIPSPNVDIFLELK